jgi:hypothetical protein
MKHACRLLLCALLSCCLLALAPAGKALCAQPGQETGPAQKKARAAKPAVRKKGAAPKTPKAKSAKSQFVKEKPKLTPEEILSPYTATQGGRVDVMKEAAKEAQQDPRLRFDPTPKEGPFAPAQAKQQQKKQEDEGPLSFHVGQDKVIDPLTGQEVKTRQDPAAAKDSLKNMDLKGTMDKVGGKAEVQVEILKF